MTVQVVGGPNERADYHDDPVEEFFYQLRGDMVLKVVDDGNFYDIPIREGDVFLLPPHVRHSATASAGRLGRPGRRAEALSRRSAGWIRMVCFQCHALVHRIELEVEHLVRICRRCTKLSSTTRRHEHAKRAAPFIRERNRLRVG